MNKLVLFIISSFISACAEKTNEGQMVIVDNNVQIAIAPCVEVNSKLLGNSVDPVAFCKFYCKTDNNTKDG
jgi:hypothetical protein